MNYDDMMSLYIFYLFFFVGRLIGPTKAYCYNSLLLSYFFFHFFIFYYPYPYLLGSDYAGER